MSGAAQSALAGIGTGSPLDHFTPVEGGGCEPLLFMPGRVPALLVAPPVVASPGPSRLTVVLDVTVPSSNLHVLVVQVRLHLQVAS